MQNEVLFEVRGSSLIVTFNNPSTGNALTSDMASQLVFRLKQVTTDKTIRAVMLRGAGGTFMNGLDMSIFKENIEKGVEIVHQLALPYHSAIRELYAMDKPVLAVVDGRVSGPGLSFMLAADLVLAGESTIINADYTTYGMSPDGGVSLALARKLGSARAAELLMLSSDYTASDMLGWGLVNGVLEDEKVHERGLAWLDKLSTGPTRAFAAVRKLIQTAFEKDLNAALGNEHTWWGASARTLDFREGIRAKLQDRPAKFSGV